jgi:hypothetical protein
VNNEYYSSDENGVLFNKNQTELIQYPFAHSRTSYTIPSTVITISSNAFKSSSKLTSITIPKSVTIIEDNVFNSCNSLKSVVFEGTKYNRAQVAGLIVNFISRIEQTWQYVLGLYELCKLWKQPDIKEITFGALDSTLRLLDQQKFKGMADWRNILIVNEYMKALHEQYAKDTTRHIAIGHRHSAIISQRDLITPISSNKEE